MSVTSGKVEALKQRRKHYWDQYQAHIRNLLAIDKKFYDENTSYAAFEDPKKVFDTQILHKRKMTAWRESVDVHYLNIINLLDYRIKLVEAESQYTKKINDLTNEFQKTHGGLFGDQRILDRWDKLNFKNTSRVDYIAIRNIYKEIHLMKQKYIYAMTVLNNSTERSVLLIKNNRSYTQQQREAEIKRVFDEQAHYEADLLRQYHNNLVAAISEMKFDQKSPEYFRKLRANVNEYLNSQIKKNNEVYDRYHKHAKTTLNNLITRKEDAVKQLKENRYNVLNKQNKEDIETIENRIKILDNHFDQAIKIHKNTIDLLDADKKLVDQQYKDTLAKIDEMFDALNEKNSKKIDKLEENLKTAQAKLDALYKTELDNLDKKREHDEEKYQADVLAYEQKHQAAVEKAKAEDAKNLAAYEAKCAALHAQNEKSIEKITVPFKKQVVEVERETEAEKKHQLVAINELEAKVEGSRKKFETQSNKITADFKTKIDELAKKCKLDVENASKKKSTFIKNNFAESSVTKVDTESNLARLDLWYQKSVDSINAKTDLAVDKLNKEFKAQKNLIITPIEVKKITAIHDQNLENLKTVSKENLENLRKEYEAKRAVLKEKIEIDTKNKKRTKTLLPKVEVDVKVLTALEVKTNISAIKYQHELEAQTLEVKYNEEVAALSRKHEAELTPALAKLNEAKAQLDEFVAKQNLKVSEIRNNELVAIEHARLELPAKTIEPFVATANKVAEAYVLPEKKYIEEFKVATRAVHDAYTQKVKKLNEQSKNNIEKQKQMNKIEADNFAYDILVAKAKDINETVVEEINQKREKAENAFAEAKKKYEADIAELESKLTTLRNIHRKYEDNLAEVIKDDIAQVESKFNVHIDHINAELKQHENTLNRNNEKVKAEVADLLKKISTNEFNSSVELRRRIGYDRVDELGRQYAINPATNKALAVDSINRPRRGFSQKFYNDLWLYGVISAVLLIIGLCERLHLFDRLFSHFDNYENVEQMLSVVGVIALFIGGFGAVIITLGSIFAFFAAGRRELSRFAFPNKLTELKYYADSAKIFYDCVQDYPSYTKYIKAKNRYLVAKAQKDHNDAIAHAKLAYLSEHKRILDAKPKYLYTKETAKRFHLLSRAYAFRNGLRKIKREYAIEIQQIKHRKHLRAQKYHNAMHAATTKIKRQVVFEEYELAKRTFAFQDRLDIENAHRNFVNKYNRLCIQCRHEKAVSPIVQLGILKHHKMTSEFQKVREQSANTLALLKTRIDETEGIAREADRIENAKKVVRNAEKLVNTATVLLIIFAIFLIVGTEAYIFFPGTLNQELFTGFTILHLAIVLASILFVFVLIYSLVASAAKSRAANVKKLNIDLYRVQQDKIAKLKNLNRLIVNEVANVCNIAIDVEKDNYNMAHDAYLESLHDLEDQMNSIEAANVSIQQKIHEYHNEKNALLRSEHKKVLETIHELYVKQVKAFQEKYRVLMQRKDSEFSNYSAKLKAELMALKQRKEMIMNHDGTDISYDQLLLEPNKVGAFTSTIEENVEEAVADQVVPASADVQVDASEPEQPVSK